MNNNNMHNSNNKIDVNQKNNEEFNRLMQNASIKRDAYWDINSPILKIILIILLFFALAGSVYYIITWLLTK